MERQIQIIYAPGTWGNCVRWLLDRFTAGSNFSDSFSPWDSNKRVHGNYDLYNSKFLKAHQIDTELLVDPTAQKILIAFEERDLLFAERCGFYRNPENINDEHRYKEIIKKADKNFVKNTFGSVSSSKSVAKELLKIQFHDRQSHTWWNAINKLYNDDRVHNLDLNLLYDSDGLYNELQRISAIFNLDLKVDRNIINTVTDEIQGHHVVSTRNRAHDIIKAVENGQTLDCTDLDIVEQAYIEVELEIINDSVIFPYGTNWFKNTSDICDFLQTYPTYLKHMNPRLPWYKNRKNPYFLTNTIDKSK